MESTRCFRIHFVTAFDKSARYQQKPQFQSMNKTIKTELKIMAKYPYFPI